MIAEKLVPGLAGLLLGVLAVLAYVRWRRPR